MMTDKSVSSRSVAPEEGINDLLARLYREIGISAVAGALEAMAFKPGREGEPADSPMSAASERSEKKDLAA